MTEENANAPQDSVKTESEQLNETSTIETRTYGFAGDGKELLIFDKKNAAKAAAKNAINSMENAEGLYCVGLEAQPHPHNPKAHRAKITFQNTQDEPVMAEFIERHGKEFEIVLVEWTEGSTRAKAEAKAAAKATAGGTKRTKRTGATKRSKHAGATIVPGAATEKRPDPVQNPRKEGTHGWNSWNLLMACWKRNVDDGKGEVATYEEYIAEGGRPNDLQWDADHDYVKIIPAEGGATDEAKEPEAETEPQTEVEGV